MRVVLDTTILFTFFWKESFFRDLIRERKIVFFSPTFALKELEKYAEEIQEKTKTSEKEFKEIKKELEEKVIFVEKEKYEDILKETWNNIKNQYTKEERDKVKEDIDFLALAAKLNCIVWSNDNLLKKQKNIEAISTAEIIEIIKEFINKN